MAKEALSLKKRRDLKSELSSLPVLNFFTTTYDNFKSKHAVFQTGLGMVEYGFSKVGSRLLSYVDDPGELETMALNYVRQAKENYPIIKKTPKGIYRKTKNNVIEWSLKKTQTVLQTAPGKVVVWSVGAASSLSDKALSTAYYVTNTKPPEKRSKDKQGKHVVLKSPQRKRRNSLKDKTRTFVECTVVLPIQVTSKILQTAHLWLHLLIADAEEQNRKKQQSLSPAKAEEIKNRRKVSPRKRTKSSAIKSWSKSAVHFFGLDRILPFFKPKSFLKNIDPLLKDSSPNKSDDSEKKRKYDDILSDSDDDEPSYLDHLKRFDLSHYISDEDPDYEPSQESTDNEEYVMGETDSDEDLAALSPAHPSKTLGPRNRGTPVPVSTPSKTKTDVSTKTVPNQQVVKENESKAKLKTNNNEKVKPDESKDVVQLTFKASRLDSKDLNGKSDPYLTLKKQSQDGKWQLIHKTEYIPNSCDPSWRPFSVPLLSLWNGDKTKQIKIAVYDNDTFDDDFVGEAIVTLEEILKASKQEVTWNIVNPKKQSKKKNYLNSGQVHLVSCKGNTDMIHVKKSTIVSVSVGLSVSATIILAFLVSHF